MEFCIVVGCNRTVEKEDLCSKHYAHKCLGIDLDTTGEPDSQEEPEENPEKVEKFKPKHEYDKKNSGLKVADRKALLKEQDKKCACCGRPIPRLIQAKVDFNPQTGMVRELVCKGCHYVMRGSMADVKRLKMALTYARRHESGKES